ncbi:hypothetical protein N7G274_005078 [Stereocaulon virgatum]|uniref:Uncharacterized protein n=1 Tax=Stereocaulon virgatum TaxID=373712 RepID=A0ABR4A8Z6_9LECA
MSNRGTSDWAYIELAMEIKQQTGFIAPDSFDDGSSEEHTPDLEALRIMRSQDSRTKVGRATSFWDGLSPDDSLASQATPIAKQHEWQGATTETLEPISGVPYSKTRIYGRHAGGEWIFFGVREPGIRMREFWAKYDPDETRGDCGGSDLSLSASPEPVDSKPRVGARSKRCQQTPMVNDKNGVRKSATPPPNANTRTKRSLALKGNVDSTDGLQLTRQPHMEAFVRPRLASTSNAAQEINGKGGPARRKTSSKATAVSRSTKKAKGDATLALQFEGKTLTTKDDKQKVDIPTPMRRTPALDKPTRQAEKKQKPTQARGNAKVTKQKKLNERVPALSAHKMRTRTQGPAENLQLS